MSEAASREAAESSRTRASNDRPRSLSEQSRQVVPPPPRAVEVTPNTAPCALAPKRGRRKKRLPADEPGRQRNLPIFCLYYFAFFLVLCGPYYDCLLSCCPSYYAAGSPLCRRRSLGGKGGEGREGGLTRAKYRSARSPGRIWSFPKIYAAISLLLLLHKIVALPCLCALCCRQGAS